MKSVFIMSPWYEHTLKLYKIHGADIIYLHSKVAMKGRTFDKMVLSLSRQGLQVAHVSSAELSAEEARRRGYKKEAYYIVEPVTTQCA